MYTTFGYVHCHFTLKVLHIEFREMNYTAHTSVTTTLQNINRAWTCKPILCIPYTVPVYMLLWSFWTWRLHYHTDHAVWKCHDPYSILHETLAAIYNHEALVINNPPCQQLAMHGEPSPSVHALREVFGEHMYNFTDMTVTQCYM